MRRARCGRWLPAGVLAAGCLGLALRASRAAEECQRFLDGLRDRGYHDMALEYLEQMRTSPLAGQDFKTAIDYEAGITLKRASQMGRVRSVREKQLGEAREMFKRFLAGQPDHPLAAGANTELANLLVERGKLKREQAGEPNRSSQEKNRLTKEARTLYREAEKVFGELEQRFLEAHRKFPKFIEKKDTKLLEERDQVRRDLLQARLALATVRYQIAQTYEPTSSDNVKSLEAAADKYKELYEKYSAILAGLYAHMWEGRCYKELGRTEEAFAAFEDLLAQPNNPKPFRLLRNKTLVFFLETAVLPDVRQYERAIAEAKKWEAQARGQDETSPEDLAIKYLAGEASFEYARSLAKKKDGDEATIAEDRKAGMTRARRLFKEVADRPGEYQKQAKAMLRRKEFAGEEVEIPEPTDFLEASDRAKDALDLTQDPQATPAEIAQARREAIHYYRLAIRMLTAPLGPSRPGRPSHYGQATVDPDQMNVIRYYLAYLYWMSGDVYEAAVLGEFLARRYSDGPGARQGARIAMAAYGKLYNEAPREDRRFETERLVGIAEYITQRWKGEPEADEAWMLLIGNALRDGDLQKAQQYLANVSADSPRRGEAELMTGQKLWAAYLSAASKQGADQEKLSEMVSQAQQTLENGIARMHKAVDAGGDVTYTLVASVLSLAQIYIGASEPQKAVQWLEDPNIGALKLVEAKHAVTDRGNFQVETYKAALRAYVATQQLDKAETVMKALEERIGQAGDAEAGRKLTRIYISLGRELQNQLERLRNEQKAAEADKVSKGFQRFLERISQREEGITFNSLNWVAETFVGLGAGFDTGGTTLPEEAKDYYEKAAETYRKILKLCADEKIECPPGATDSIRIRLARCLRRLHEYPQARDLLVEILNRRSTMVDAQIEAAYTYQEWAAERPTAYNLAIKGSTKYKEIWGWGRLANRVHGHKKYESVFHEARYNLAKCRRRLAESKSQAAERKALANQAKRDILIVLRLYPQMGGKQWYAKYDEELRKIQQLLREKETGLKGALKKE